MRKNCSINYTLHVKRHNELLCRGLHFDHHVYTPRLSCRHKVITEVAQSRWWINIARVESTDGRERRESDGWREESDDGQAGVNETSSSSNSCFVNFRGSELVRARISAGNSRPYTYVQLLATLDKSCI